MVMTFTGAKEPAAPRRYRSSRLESGEYPMKQIDRVLYVLDDSLDSMVALSQVLLVAGERGWRLNLFSVIDSIGSSARMLVTCTAPNELKARILDQRRRQLEALISMIANNPGQLTASVSFGNRAKEIHREFSQGGYDLLIKQGENNSTDNYLKKHCDQALWLLQPGDTTQTGDRVTANLPDFVTRA